MDSGLPNIIDSLLINLDNLQLGADFTEEMTFTGYHNISHMTMSFRVECAPGYCGPDCTTTPKNNQYVLQCRSNGEVVCSGNWSPNTECSGCLHNYNFSTNCTQCLGNHDPSMDCSTCLTGWNITSDCMTCLTGRDLKTNCTQCLPNHDPSTDCSTCLLGWDSTVRCSTCLSNREISTNCTACRFGYTGDNCQLSEFDH